MFALVATDRLGRILGIRCGGLELCKEQVQLVLCEKYKVSFRVLASFFSILLSNSASDLALDIVSWLLIGPCAHT